MRAAPNRLVDWLGLSAVSDARIDNNAASFKTGALEIEPDAILERHQFDIEIGDVFAFCDFARRATRSFGS